MMQTWELTTDQTRLTHLLIDIGDVLLALAVHIEDLKKGFVDAFIIRKASLQSSSAICIPQLEDVLSHIKARQFCDMESSRKVKHHASDGIP